MNKSQPRLVRITPQNAEQAGRSVSLSDIKSPLVHSAVETWNQLRGARKFPARTDLSPHAISKFLRNSVLYRLLEGASDYEIRVMGDGAVYAYGMSYQGMKMSDVNRVTPGMGDIVGRVCTAVFNRRDLVAFKGCLSTSECEIINQEIVFLPLGPTDTLVDHILSIGDYSPRKIGQS